jgi:Domain of unknown function (DUF4124)
MFRRFKVIVPRYFFLVVFILFFSKTSAQEIFQWTDEDGITHYSSKKEKQDAIKAKLPELGRENLNRKIEKLNQIIPETCDSHGGINCEAGADADGSVICFDDYRDSATTFLSMCTEVKLEISKIRYLDKDDKPIEYKKNRDPLTKLKEAEKFLLTVRNRSAIKAESVIIKLIIPDGARIIDEYSYASGESEIAPYGLAEYSFTLKSIDRKVTPLDLSNVIYKVTCENCPL